MLSAIPQKLPIESLKSFLKVIDRLSVCAGQPDEKFVKFIKSKKGVLIGRKDETVAYLDECVSVTLNGQTYPQTIRSVKCEILVTNGKCTACKKYRATLRVMSNRYNSRSSLSSSDYSSHSNIKFLNTPERKSRMKNLSGRARAIKKKMTRLQKKIKNLSDKCGEDIDPQLHSDLVTVMNENSSHIDKVCPVGSFANLFWKEQLKASSLKDQRQMRWHPLIIRWCLNLKLMSSSGYHATRTAGFIKLPSERTLRDYTNYFEHEPGFQNEILKQLRKESKLADLPDSKRFCGIIIDEMKIREGLVYCKQTGDITGFCNLGSINDDLSELERNQCDVTPKIAKQMLVIMIRGIFFKLEFPLAHFSTGDLTGEQTFPIVWEAVRRVESIGLKVIFITGDGASHNRKFFKYHRASNEALGLADKVCYRTKNRYSPKLDRWIYFFSDPPHLVKTARNCLQHSGFGGTRLMTVSYLVISVVYNLIILYTVEEFSVHYMETHKRCV